MVPRLRQRMSDDERQVAKHLRGNTDLRDGLKGIIQARIEGRLQLPEPSDPVVCKSMAARDRELQWLLGRLELIYRSPVSEPADLDDEQPA
jgi:hypothetical protein